MKQGLHNYYYHHDQYYSYYYCTYYCCYCYYYYRFNLFRLGKHSEELFPPTNDSLGKHILRANYQAAIWRRSLEQAQDLPGPVGNGWQLSDDGALEIYWCDLPCAPESVLMTVQCSCKTGGCGSAAGMSAIEKFSVKVQRKG